MFNFTNFSLDFLWGGRRVPSCGVRIVSHLRGVRTPRWSTQGRFHNISMRIKKITNFSRHPLLNRNEVCVCRKFICRVRFHSLTALKSGPLFLMQTHTILSSWLSIQHLKQRTGTKSNTHVFLCFYFHRIRSQVGIISASYLRVPGFRFRPIG